MEEVTRQAADETRKAFQVAVQLARFFAERRRRQLEGERREPLARAGAAARLIERERALAAPVVRRGLDDGFWRSARPADAAYVYGVATRFQDLDPMARAAADRCRREASERWNVDLGAPAPPIGPGEVDGATLGAVAPVLAGEEDRDLGRDLADSARAAVGSDDEAWERLLNTPAPPDPEAEEAAPPDPEAERTAPAQAPPRARAGGRGARRSQTRRRTREQTPPESRRRPASGSRAGGRDASGPRAGAGRSQAPPRTREQTPPESRQRPAPSAAPPADPAREEAEAWEWFNKHYDDPKALGEYASEPERRRNALALYSALAAEGRDLDDPPEIRPITGRSATTAADEAGATAGYKQQLSDWLGVDAARADTIDPRAAGPMMAAWRAEADGAYPNLDEWAFHVYDKGAQAAGEQVAPVRLVGRDPAPGLYTPLMLRAAADEAARAGLPPETYLDHLQPIQRRGLLAARTGATTGYEDALERASQYRVAYARASAAQRPDWSKRGSPDPTRTAARRPAHSAAPPAPDATGPALADRPTGRSAAAPETRAPGPGAPAWDSPAARDAWAAGLIAAGIDPAAVRAARTGDQALHEPAHRATRPARGSSTPPVKPPSPRTLTHRQRV